MRYKPGDMFQFIGYPLELRGAIIKVLSVNESTFGQSFKIKVVSVPNTVKYQKEDIAGNTYQITSAYLKSAYECITQDVNALMYDELVKILLS